LCGFTDRRDFQGAQRQWVEQALENGCAPRDDRWSDAIAVGSLAFVKTVKDDLGIKAMHREVLETDGTYALHEPSEAYTRNLTAGCVRAFFSLTFLFSIYLPGSFSSSGLA
jgi:hypothetical protein